MRLLVFALALLAGATASAQPMWRPALDGPSVSLDVLKAFDQALIVANDQGDPIGEFGTSFFQSAQVLSARVPVGARLAVVADLPTAYARYSLPGGALGETLRSEGVEPSGDFVVGNPYLGLQAQLRPDVEAEIGVRLPLSPRGNLGIGSDAAAIGVVALFEMPEAFREGTFSASAGVRYKPRLAQSVHLRLHVVPSVLVYSSFRGSISEGGLTDRSDVQETVFALRYGAHVVADLGPAELSGGVVGRVDDTEPFEVGGGTFVGRYEPTILTLGATVGGLPVRPGLTARVPLHGGPFENDMVVGLSLDVPLR